MKKALIIFVVVGAVVASFAYHSGMVGSQSPLKAIPREVQPGKAPGKSGEIGFEFQPWETDVKAFQEGLAKINATQPDLRGAITIFEGLIKNNPRAKDIDYSIGWTMVCHARLGNWGEALALYRIMRERFSGTVEGGASGALRIWDNRFEEVRNLAASSTDSKAAVALEEMRKLDAVATQPVLFPDIASPSR